MSRYLKLQELISQDTILEKLSFYPDHLLDFRSVLSEWVEAQDWSGTLSLRGRALTNRSKELFLEALSLLQDKQKNAGFEFYIRKFETKLKKAYQNQPQKFVEDLHHCLSEEEQLLQTMMAQDGAMSFDRAPFRLQMSIDELSAQIANCRKLDQRVLQVLKAAFLCLEKWPEDIQKKSEVNRDVYGNGCTILPPYSVFKGLREELERKSHSVIQELNAVLMGLESFVMQWKTRQLHECVSRKVEGDSSEKSKQVEDMCEHVCACVYSLMKCASSKELQRVDSAREQSPQPATSPSIPTPSMISWFCMALKDIMKKIVEMLLVVKKQPDLTMMIEKEKGQKDKEDINNSKKFTTTVGILGGKGFEEGIIISDVEIYLAYSQDLAVAQQTNNRPEKFFKIYHDRQDARAQYAARYNAGDLDSPSVAYERTYKKLRVEHFSRKETKHVYKQLYHVVYDVRLHFPLFMQEFQAQTFSLPIIVRTGANQASEHIGAQLWHSFTSQNVANLRGEMVPSMKVSEVTQMIDERIKFIGGEGLRPHEKEFLKERLQMVARAKGGNNCSADPTITLDNFIKDKVYLPRHGSATGEKDVRDFSLWRWLHAIINLLDAPENLNKPWIDGVIYGFASRQQCIKALQGSRDGTFLLRFSESVLHGNHIMSKGGLAAVIQRNGQADFAPPISAEDIERDGMGNMIARIGCQYLLGTSLSIEDLCDKYPALKPLEDPTHDRYQGWSKKEYIVPIDSVQGSEPQISSLPTTSVPKQRPHKRPKRSSKSSQNADISSSKQYYVGGPGSPDSMSSQMSSPMAMSPDGRSQFQPVGLQEVMPQSMMSWEESPASTIPNTVPTHMNGVHGVDQNLTITANSNQQTMILEFPGVGSQLMTDGCKLLDISSSVMVSSEACHSPPSFVVANAGGLGTELTYLFEGEDPRMVCDNQLLSTHETHSIEQLEEYLKRGVEELSLPQHS